MQAEVVVGLASAGLAAMVVASSTVATVLSLRGQRENTKATLEAQQALASMQEEALRERLRSDAIRAQQVVLYKILIIWAEGLLGAPCAISAERPKVPHSYGTSTQRPKPISTFTHPTRGAYAV
jgi:hypothetical protein